MHGMFTIFFVVTKFLQMMAKKKKSLNIRSTSHVKKIEPSDKEFNVKHSNNGTKYL